jgi:serine/threonine-protein kinase
LETGGDPTKPASDFLDRHEAWARSPRRDEDAISDDLTMPMLRVLRRAGRVSAADFESSRQAWLRDWDRPSPFARYAWFQAYAGGAETADEAREALTALPKYEPLPVTEYTMMWGAEAGRVRLLAGDAPGALPLLASATRECRALTAPVEHTCQFAPPCSHPICRVMQPEGRVERPV